MSAIDVTMPVFGNPTTQSVRENFVRAKGEIEELDRVKAPRSDLANYLPLTGGTLTGLLTLSAKPTADLHAATKSYVDAAPFLPMVGGTLTGPLLLAADPSTAAGAATRRYVDASAEAVTNAANARFLPLAGGVLTGALMLLGDPTDPLGAANKRYVDDQISQVAGITEAPQTGFAYGRRDRTWAQVLPITGGTLTGALAVNGYISSNVADGISIGAPVGTSARYMAHLADNRAWAFGAITEGFTITDESGATWRMLIETDGNIRFFGGSLVSQNGVFANGGTDFGLAQSGVQRLLQWTPGWWDGWNTTDGTRVWAAPGGAQMSLDGAGSLWVLGNISTGASVTAGRLSTPAGEISTLTVWADAHVNGTLHASGVSTGVISGSDLNLAGTMASTWATIHGSMTANYYSGNSLAVNEITAHGTANSSAVTTGRVDVSGLGIRYTGFGAFHVAFMWDGTNLHGIVDGTGIGHIPCDQRVKDITGAYPHGLAEVLQIDPMIYRYRCNDHAPGTKNIRDGNREHIGVSAQQAERVIPEMVKQRAGYIDGRPVNDLRELTGTEPLLYALVNSIKELHARLAVVEEGNAHV